MIATATRQAEAQALTARVYDLMHAQDPDRVFEAGRLLTTILADQSYQSVGCATFDDWIALAGLKRATVYSTMQIAAVFDPMLHRDISVGRLRILAGLGAALRFVDGRVGVVNEEGTCLCEDVRLMSCRALRVLTKPLREPRRKRYQGPVASVNQDVAGEGATDGESCAEVPPTENLEELTRRLNALLHAGRARLGRAIEAGQHLQRLKEEKLYRELGYLSFDAFLAENKLKPHLAMSNIQLSQLFDVDSHATLGVGRLRALATVKEHLVRHDDGRVGLRDVQSRLLVEDVSTLTYRELSARVKAIKAATRLRVFVIAKAPRLLTGSARAGP
jgi:hypothetical protein